MARVAESEGIKTIAATPHVRADYPVAIGELAQRRAALNRSLSDAAIAVNVVAGGELALTQATDLTDAELAAICLGNGDYLLVEAPSTSGAELLEKGLFSLQTRGFRPLLAHPERSRFFLGNPSRLGDLVRRGVIFSITAGSLAGRFGKPAREFALAMFREGLVHNIASDAHDAASRHPGLSAALRALRDDAPDDEARWHWLTREAPAAIVNGESLPTLAPVWPKEHTLTRGIRALGLGRSRR